MEPQNAVRLAMLSHDSEDLNLSLTLALASLEALYN